MGGHFQGRLYPRNEDERSRAIAAGYDLDAILHTDDLAKGDQVGSTLDCGCLDGDGPNVTAPWTCCLEGAAGLDLQT